MDEKVSIIVPVYNVEKYISECLDSLINQTYENLEILIIDDCGNDNSMKICENFLEKDDRIKIIKHEKNCGVSCARNTGLDNATGKYIYFIDSDDFIDENYIKKLVEAKKKYKCNLVCNYNILKYYGKNHKKNKFLKKLDLIPTNQIFSIDDKKIKDIPISPCCKIYETKFLIDNNIKFIENLRFEDFYFYNILKTQAKKIVFINDTTYFYRQNENSFMHGFYKKNQMDDAVFIVEKLYEYYKNNNLLDKYSIPFKWINKFFKKQNNKNRFFTLVKSVFLKMGEDVAKNKNIYNKKDLNTFNFIINSKNYLSYKIKSFFVKII